MQSGYNDQLRAWKEHQDSIIKEHNANPVPERAALLAEIKSGITSPFQRYTPEQITALSKYSIGHTNKLDAAGPRPIDPYPPGSGFKNRDSINPPSASAIQRESQYVPYRTGRAAAQPVS